MTFEFQVTIDSADPAALSAFWAEVLGYRLQDPPPGFDTWDAALDAMGIPEDRRNDASALIDPAAPGAQRAGRIPSGVGARIFFQRVPETKTVKNRVHLDVRAAPGLSGDERMAALERRCAELIDAGATRIARHEPAPPLQNGHLVMADPEGNEFCLD
ncbi:VOC family protein [Gordonia sp. DT30]|uniref:VOC family protein n=1 Tax=unclassified Gordonia (in: high G+C Gram-positive bacteria) TaxID=2657482 RepID=UPI003CF07713